MYALSSSDSGDMSDTRLPTALLPDLSRCAASARHVADTFVADGRDGDLFFCLYRSVITGELQPDLDLDVLVDVIYGPIFHRMLMEHAPLNDAFIEQVLRIALNGALVQE